MYKINFNQIRTFVEISILGILINHDSYQVFLAIASAMIAYFLVLSFFKTKAGRFLSFTFLAVAICQLSVTVKKAVMDVGFRQIAKENPTGVLVSDVVYGFRAVAVTVGRSFGAVYQALGLDKYSSLESLNYRFFTIIIMIFVMWLYILKQKSPAAITES